MEINKQIADLIGTARRVRRFAFLYLAITTFYTIWLLASGYFTGVGPTLHFILSLIACYGMYRFIDAGLSAQADYVFAGWMQGQARQAGYGFLIGITILFAVRFMASTFLTYVSAKPLATTIYKAPDTSDKREGILQAQGDKKATQAELKREYDRLRNSERVRIAEAKKAGKSRIDAAINAQGARVAELYREGNAWLMSDRRFKKYRQGIEEAKAEAAKLEQAEKDKTAEARAAYMSALTGKDEIAAVLAEDLKTTNETYLNNNEALTGAIYIIDFIAAFVAFVLTWIIAIAQKRYQIPYKNKFGEVWEKLTNKYQQDVLEVSEKAGIEVWEFAAGQPLKKSVTLLRWLKTILWVKLIGQIETLLKIDLDGNGDIGNKSVKPPTQTTDADTQKVGRTPIGFSVNRSAVKVGEKSVENTDALQAKSTDVGVTPTSPTSAPIFEFEVMQKVGEKSGENTPTSSTILRPDSTDFSTEKTPTSQRKKPVKVGKDRAIRDADFDRWADAARAAWKRYLADETAEKHEVWRAWRAKLIAAGFTVVSSPDGRKQSIIKPSSQDRKSKPRKPN